MSSSKSSSRTPSGPVTDAYPLRLIAAQGGLGIELYRPVQVGPIAITELVWSLPGVSFPVDLSGGVRSFSNRRGELQGLTLQCEPSTLSRWLHSRTRHLLGGTVEPPAVWFVEGGIGVGFWGKQGCVAFDFLWAPDGAAARLIVSNARGAGFPGPALAQALAITDAAFGKVGLRSGRALVLDRGIEQLLRTILPELGVRAPSVSGCQFGGLEGVGNESWLRFAPTLLPDLAPSVGRALALSDLLREGDERLLAAQPEAAREAYVAALESAPRHPEICQLVAALDCEFLDRTEAALGLLVESLPVTAFGLLGAELLLRMGDTAGAELAVTKHVQLEPYAPLSALCWVRFAELSDEASARLEYLDRALSISPRSPEARWARLMARLDASDVNGALADAEHLEAAARGSEARHAALVDAARAILERGFYVPAGKLFERALRYLPKESRAALGLAESLVATGKSERALPLLERVVKDEDEAIRGRGCLVYAKLLASTFRDLPQAIALAQRVSSARPRDAIEARALEAVWRDKLGDIAGATLAHSRLYDLCQVTRDIDASSATGFLLDASTFALDTTKDARAAHRFVALALRLNPRDSRVLGRYRDVSRLIAEAPSVSSTSLQEELPKTLPPKASD